MHLLPGLHPWPVLFFAFLSSTIALAQFDEAKANASDIASDIEEVVSIGVRTSGRVAAELPVPVDSFDSEALRNTGHAEVGRMLQTLAPSFNFSSSTISDGTDSLRPATLRGLGPDQTLVLVNGKRRHGSALLHVNGSVGRGTAGTDMNAIPGIAIDRIEILRDGASAQYGSDALAGVINLVLKDSTAGGEAEISFGDYDQGDGNTLVTNFHYGGKLGDQGSWNVAVEYRERGATNRAGLTGVCQFSCTEATDAQGKHMVTADQREIDFPRQNFRVGDADSEQVSGVLNLETQLGESNTSFYLFATYSDRMNESGGFYRRANQPRRNPVFDMDGDEVNGGEAYREQGFLPLIETTIEDYSVDVGINGILQDWQWDLSLGRGVNSFDFDVVNSLNASLVRMAGDSPSRAHSGELVLGLWSAELNLFNETGWGSVALGAAYRVDEYELNAGDEISYGDYDTGEDGSPIGIDTDANPNAAGGIQVFPGFRPSNVVDEDRNSVALYAEVELRPSENFLLTGAARYEDYSDFGDTANVKGAFVASVTENFRFRGAASTGFRAPSLQQQYFNNTSTQFSSAGELEERRTFRNDSALARAIGIPRLQEETSINLSIGFVWQPTDQFMLTADYYRIDIEDRIVFSGALTAENSEVLAEALTAEGAVSAQVFFNGADTETAGFDIVGSYNTALAGGHLTLSLGFNKTETKVANINVPTALADVEGISNRLLDDYNVSIIEKWQPEDRLSLIADYKRGGWTFVLGLQRYGEYTVVEEDSRQTFGAKNLVDTRLTYEFPSGFYITFGGNNIFDEVPDEAEISLARGGRILDDAGNLVVDSSGVFRYSRRSAPFGFNGAYWYGAFGVRF